MNENITVETLETPADKVKAAGDEEIAAACEAILFAAGHPIKYEKLSEVLGVPVYEVLRILHSVENEYNSDESKRGILLLMLEDSCQLCTKERFAPLIKEALGIRRGGNLSASSLEVLAIIAYNQPCTRAYVDMVRGVDSGYAVSSLHEKGLIEQRGRLDVPGRPILYGTTDDFLRVFGISSIDELPPVSSADAKDSEPTQETISTDALL